jgi:hypothetical protein
VAREFFRGKTRIEVGEAEACLAQDRRGRRLAHQAGQMRRCRDRKARAQALAAARPCQEMGKQLTARRGEPAGAIAAVERREARMNRVRIARSGAERYLAVDKGRAKVIREALIKETLPDRSARKQGGLRRDGLPARLRGAGEQDRQTHTMDGEKR